MLRHLRPVIAGLAVLAGLAALGCTSGSYPVDIFYEQHYQQWHKSHEPPRLAGVAGAVAFFPAPPATNDDSGATLFKINCQMCHGPGGTGDGTVLSVLESKYRYTPLVDANITNRPRETILNTLSRTERPLGPTSVMPPFGKLLNQAEREAIADYIDSLPR